MPKESKIQPIDSQWVVARDISWRFKRSFQSAPAQLGLPARNHYAFLELLKPEHPRVPDEKRRYEYVITETEGGYSFKASMGGRNTAKPLVERVLTPAEEQELIDAARTLSGTTRSLTLDYAYDVFKAEVRKLTAASIDTPIPNAGEHGDLTLAETLDAQENVEDEAISKTDFNLRSLQGSILTAREVEVLELRFGIFGEAHTLEQIGEIQGVTRERIRQIEARALGKIRRSPVFRELKRNR